MDGRADHLIARARERLALEDYYGAVHLLHEVLERGHRFADVHHLLGLAHSLLGRHEEALPHYDRALELNPRYFEAHLHRGLALNELGRQGEAQEAFREAASSNFTSPSGLPAHVAATLANEHARLGEAYAEAGVLPGAIEQYRRAVELGPEFHDLRYRLARLLLEAGEADGARRELELIVWARPGWVEARATLGLVLHFSGDPAAARKIWTACLADSPGDSRVEAYLSMLERGTT